MKINLQNKGLRSFPATSDIKKDFYLKFLWIYPLLVLCLYFISSFYIVSSNIRILCSVVLALFPWKELVNSFFNNRYKNLRSQILVLLQVLTTSVSSGYSLEKSFSLIRPVIENTFGNKCPLVKPLKELENNLKVHIGIEKSIDKFASQIQFPETLPVFHALALSSKIGSNSLAILRSSCQMLSEMNAVQNEINANNAGKNAEAVMLCVMPFAITIALDKMSNGYLMNAKISQTGSIILGIAFGMAIISCALLFKFITHAESTAKYNEFESNTKRKKNKRNLFSNKHQGIKATDIVRKVMPTSFITSRHELFSELSFNPDAAYEKYLIKQITTTISIFTLSCLVLYITGHNILLAFLPAILIYVAGIKDIRTKANLKKEELMKDLPLFLCLTYTLLEAGLQLPKAIEICESAFKDNNSLNMEIKNMRAQVLSGISSSDAIEKMALRIQIPEAQSALLLVARYGRFGTSEVLNLLSLQASACWDLCRTASRKKRERESLALLFPMTLDFICVLLVATTPAIISLGI
mgnify:CR=1 FL=1